MGRLLLVLLTVGLLLAPLSLHAEEKGQPYSEGTPSELFEGAAKRLVRALELILMAIPQYSAPELLDNGDIIIRRKPTSPYRKEDDPKKTVEPSERKI